MVGLYTGGGGGGGGGVLYFEGLIFGGSRYFMNVMSIRIRIRCVFMSQKLIRCCFKMISTNEFFLFTAG